MKKKRKGWIWIVAGVLALGLIGSGAWFFLSRKTDGSDAAYVQSVAEITGLGAIGQNGRYSGVVESKDVIEINPSGEMRVAECFVEAGDKVNEGDPLFRYDVDDLTIQHAQILIDITGLENGLRTNRDQLETLNKQLERARESAKYGLKLEIQTIELEIKKAEYDLKDKQAKAEEMQQLIDASEVASPVSGTVRSVRSETNDNPFGYSDGEETAYITIVAGTDYCVKATVSEQTVHTLYEGMPVVVRTRVDDSVHPGTIYRINTDAPESNQQQMYYDPGMGEQASKYAFYVELESIDGLLMGQHVIVDLDAGAENGASLLLPAAFLMQEDDRFFVWAANASSRIEKREVQVGAFLEELESYEITDGLTPSDRIAFPDETVHAGMRATETAFTDPNVLPDENGLPIDVPDEGMFLPDGEYPMPGVDDGLNGEFPLTGNDDGLNGEPVFDAEPEIGG